MKGESAMKTEDEIGSLITYTFRVGLFQPAPMVYDYKSLLILRLIKS